MVEDSTDLFQSDTWKPLHEIMDGCSVREVLE